jgi:hypothetical protein
MSNTMTSSPPLPGPCCALAGRDGVSVLGSWVWLSLDIRLDSTAPDPKNKKTTKKRKKMMMAEANREAQAASPHVNFWSTYL